MSAARIGVIGGSGLYAMAALRDTREVVVDTPFGAPSDAIVLGTLSGQPVAFLARHGRGHRIAPTEVNFRANVYAMKSLGVERLIAVGAVGSLREEIRPLDVVLPDQFIDRTRHRPSTFFGDGLVVHVGFADPVCADLRGTLHAACSGVVERVHDGGTYVCMEGPQFSTRAESDLYRSWGAQVIGMTHLQEAKLAREAELCFASLAFVTDYDCWKRDAPPVTVEEVIGNLQRNASAAEGVVATAVGRIGESPSCGCGSALADAIITARESIPLSARERLRPIVGRYLDG